VDNSCLLTRLHGALSYIRNSTMRVTLCHKKWPVSFGFLIFLDTTFRIVPTSGNVEYLQRFFLFTFGATMWHLCKPPVYRFIVLHIHVIFARFQSVLHSCSSDSMNCRHISWHKKNCKNKINILKIISCHRVLFF